MCLASRGGQQQSQGSLTGGCAMWWTLGKKNFAECAGSPKRGAPRPAATPSSQGGFQWGGGGLLQPPRRWSSGSTLGAGLLENKSASSPGPRWAARTAALARGPHSRQSRSSAPFSQSLWPSHLQNGGMQRFTRVPQLKSSGLQVANSVGEAALGCNSKGRPGFLISPSCARENPKFSETPSFWVKI